jgi:alkanesulfonate monooxygenase SsuD/methylene tetrahydromethanopterin reductase-like flavin-dependent oxidoreductase (luciferase family)
MKTGLLLTTGSASDNLDTAKLAEAAGYHSVWCVDFQSSNALVQAAAIAAATDRIEIGTGIANTFTRSPMVLGSGILDIDALSGGRFRPGLGTGLQRMNEEWYAVEFGKPVTRARELFGLLRQLFATKGPGFLWQGDSWQIKIPAYLRQPGPRAEIPLLLAGVNRGMISAAGEFADGLVGHPVHSRRWHREVSMPLLQQAQHNAGRPEGSCPIFPHIIVALNNNADLARFDAKCQIGFSFSVEHYHSILALHGLESVGVACRKLLATYDFKGMAKAIPDALVDEIAIACTPDEFAGRLAQWQDITPEPMLFPASIALPAERRAENMSHLLRAPLASTDHQE